MNIRIAIDAMGGDKGLEVTIPASINALNKFSDLHLILVGDEPKINQVLANLDDFPRERLSVQSASQVVDMDELPSQALRSKKDSSMRVALDLVKQDQAQACVSAGNTGALMATAKFVLKTLPGIYRPAICTAMPTMKKPVYMLDLGANVGADGESLAQFAIMGSVLAKTLHPDMAPRVGLLNIGEEEMKGHDRIKLAQQLLRDAPINYIGYVEGDDIFKGDADVIACDGFDGNVALKASEGVAKMISYYLKQAFMRNALTKVVGLMAAPVLKAFKAKVDPRNYNGASFLGLRKCVIKSHGGADSLAFENAIKVARIEVLHDVPSRIRDEVARLLDEQNHTTHKDGLDD
ncbi:phosphate acyltransferase PlsX [Thiomicrospira sp. ALE5]|uniref:phosphate acyltransferase PlsX n=1 Tax=Thiomicrospira sp. ALE5 TaxID=748650 RepID=UPI0008DF6BF0|nr:phosphate acyltransferase PlsX [Thiomicrospira sp. ALE5]SFR52167.1 phosphate:acyl-[acyl carrier protein] acyltransferase [Thiomicrospira sp. ALE5]